KDTSVVVSCRKLDYVHLKLNLHRIDVEPLDIRRIYSFIGNYLEDEEQERLFWALGGRQTRNTWSWLRNLNPETTFDDFWFGEVQEEVFQWEVEKRYLKEIQDTLRETGELPGMLGIVTNPFLLFITINLYTRLGEPPANRGQLFDQFVTLLMEKRG